MRDSILGFCICVFGIGASIEARAQGTESSFLGHQVERRLEQEQKKGGVFRLIFIHEKLGRMKTGFKRTKGNGASPGAPALEEGIRFSVNPVEVQKLIEVRPNLIHFPIELPDQSVEVLLYRENILDSGFQTTDEKGVGRSIAASAFYRGAIQGKTGSLASFSFFENGKFMGFVFLEGKRYDVGNLRPSKNASRPKFNYSEPLNPSFSEEDALVHAVNDLESGGTLCSSDIIPAEAVLPGSLNTISGNSVIQNAVIQGNPNVRPVKIHFEADYDMYVRHGSSISNVTSFLTGLFNQVAVLYANDGMTLQIGSIKVFTTPDPFATIPGSSGSYSFLTAFSNYLSSAPAYVGDFAHLVSTRSMGLGGIGSIGSICNPSTEIGFSNISDFYSAAPVYSWSVEVIAHELGHNMGSKHTHACAWTVNGVENSAIDGCFAVEGSCAAGPIPAVGTGGTIMSYCHTKPAGINFSNGFGPLPGALMRSRIASATCLQSSTPLDITAPTLSVSSPSSGSVSGSVTVSGVASDVGGVARVQVIRDTTILSNIQSGFNPFSFVWDTTATPNGAHTLTLQAFDANNNASPATVLSVSVNNATTTSLPDASGPTVVFSAAFSTARIATWESVPVDVSVSDPSGVASIHYFLNGTQICSTVPLNVKCYLSVLTTAKTYTLNVRATDLLGNTTERTVSLKSE